MVVIIENIMLYIDKNPAAITVKDVAEEFYYCKDYLNRIFRNKFNMSLRQYIITQRVNLAEKYMDNGMSAKKAGEMSGFANFSNFIRTYKKYKGVTPGIYINNKQ